MTRSTDAAEPHYPTLHVHLPAEAVEATATQLFSLGATGVEERDASTLDRPVAPGETLLVAHFEAEDEARIAGALVGYPSELVHVVGDDWKHRWREFFKASRVGERIVVRPPWEEVEAGPRDVVITIDPGVAFGTGTHESTRLCLACVELLVKGGERVLDVGTGSGILSIAAIQLGAAGALGLDIDDDSMRASRENAERNGVAARFEASRASVVQIEERFPLVIANIESRVLVPLAADIAARVAAGGRLVLSGLLVPEIEEVRKAYRGLDLVEAWSERDWLAMILERPAKKAATKKAATKKAATKKAATKKAATKKAATKKAATKKAATKKAARKR